MFLFLAEEMEKSNSKNSMMCQKSRFHTMIQILFSMVYIQATALVLILNFLDSNGYCPNFINFGI